MSVVNIPEGYQLIPNELYFKFFKRLEWEDIIEPTPEDVSKYLGIGIEKVKKDMQKPLCPLRKTKQGGKGRGNHVRFMKSTVEAYRIWILNN